MPAMFTIRTEGQKCSTLNHVFWLCTDDAIAIDRPAGRDRIAFPSSHFDLAISGGTGSHVDHDWRLLFSGETNRDRVGTEHALRSP